jgi:SAM-dependent methyltransferase
MPQSCVWNLWTWQFVRCLACRHRYTDPMPTDDELARMYSADYFAADGEWACGVWNGGYLDNEAKLRVEAREALGVLGRSSGRLLEIGCAGGIFLDEARRAGFVVAGIELNETMVQHAREQLELDVTCGAFESADLAAASYDVVVAQDVLEHVRDPRAFVGKVAAVLAPGGTFVVRGPLEAEVKVELYRYLRRMLRRRDRRLRSAPYHLQGFTPASFRRLIRETGLSMRYFYARPGPLRRPRNVKGVLAGAIEAVSWGIDRARGGGLFMVARAERPAAMAAGVRAVHAGEQASGFRVAKMGM